MHHTTTRGRRGIAAAAFTIAITTAACGNQQAPATDISGTQPKTSAPAKQGFPATSADAAERRAQQRTHRPAGFPGRRIPDARP